MPLDLSNKTKIVCVVIVAVIVFIGVMVGTSLRKLSTEEGKSFMQSLQNKAGRYS